MKSETFDDGYEAFYFEDGLGWFSMLVGPDGKVGHNKYRFQSKAGARNAAHWNYRNRNALENDPRCPKGKPVEVLLRAVQRK